MRSADAAGRRDGPDDGLVRRAEQAAFHLGPRDAVAVTGPTLRAATEGRDASGVLVWCHAVSLGAAGEYGAALAALESTPATGPGGARLLSLRGSLLRQLGRHAEARVLDAAVLADDAAEPVGRADAAVGLVADAIGVAAPEAAAEALHRADRLLATGADGGLWGASSEHGWRFAVRREWVAAELALLVEQPAEAAEHAGRAARLAADVAAPRHLAKSWLLAGVAGQDVELVRSCLEWAREQGCLSLRWPAALVLAHLSGTEPDGPDWPNRQRLSRALLAEAAAGVRAIADGLADHDQALWLARPEVVTLLGEQHGDD